jgi:lipoate-protein ligase B
MPPIWLIDLGRADYQEIWQLQKAIHNARSEDNFKDCLTLVEHPHVLTIGRKGQRENILVSQAELKKRQVQCYHVERGGDVTYHGPGQLVGYPIFNLRALKIGVVEFVDRLEQMIIDLLASLDITGERNKRNRGVWIDEKKIAAIGVAVKKGISYHGFALNIDTDLSFFELIHPCGLEGVQITSINQILNTSVTMAYIKGTIDTYIAKVFDREVVRIDKEVLVEKGLLPDNK